MTYEHNPVIELLRQIQRKWTDDVSLFPKLKLVRWLIKPEEARLYEDFLKIESTEHGAIPEILVAGDANGVSMFVQSAAHQARVGAENAVLNAEKVYNPQAIATGSFTEPEYGSVGMTEDQAQKEHECLIETLDYTGLPRAIMDGKTDGFCKLIVDRKTNLLLGAHVLGSYSAEVIQVAATCIVAKMDIHAIAELELAFPTFTEAIGMTAQRISRKLRLEEKNS